MCRWVLPGHRDRRRSEKGRSGLGDRLGATWSARFFPMFPSLYCVMNGFLLVCGRGLSLNSILTKSQNTHSSQSASHPASILPSECWRPPFHLLQTVSVLHRHTGRSGRDDSSGTSHFMSPHLLDGFCRCLCDSWSDLFPPRVPEGSDKKGGGGMLEVLVLI